MVDYGQDPNFVYYCEPRLDEPMALGGIKVFNFFPIGMGTFVCLFTTKSMLLALSLLSVSIIFARRCFKAENKGSPLTHHQNIMPALMVVPAIFRLGLFPSLLGLNTYKKMYRGQL